MSPVSVTTFLFVLAQICHKLPFTLSHVSGFLLTALRLPSSSKLTLALEVFLGLALIVAASAAFVLFVLMLIVATPVLLLALLYAVKLLLKISNFYLFHH